MSTSPPVPKSIVDAIASATGSTDVIVGETLQSLWSGYGGIIQLKLVGKQARPVILKLINPPTSTQHPRGWNTDHSNQRKIASYKIETHWYEHYANLCTDECRVPKTVATGEVDTSRWILLEDLNTQYPKRAMNLSVTNASVCLQWLAAFHAQFFSVKPDGLWPTGTYWHLNTRADELDAMPEGELKAMAGKLDDALSQCPYQSLVHGDAKVANFCFSEDGRRVAAVDFQYVGGGVGVKDVAYFLGSCIDESALEQHEQALLDCYFNALTDNLTRTHNATLARDVVSAWSDLYAIAWTDFYRFLQGWSPGHQKINRYTRQLAQRALTQLS